MNNKDKFRLFQYRFTIFVESVEIKVKFPCVFSLTWKIDKTIMQANHKVPPINNKINFQKQFTCSVQLLYNQLKNVYQKKKTKLCINFNSTNKPNQIKLAGIVALDLSQYVNKPTSEQKFEKYAIQKCPDKTSFAILRISYEKIKELDMQLLIQNLSVASNRKRSIQFDKLTNRSGSTNNNKSVISAFQKQQLSYRYNQKYDTRFQPVAKVYFELNGDNQSIYRKNSQNEIIKSNSKLDESNTDFNQEILKNILSNNVSRDDITEQKKKVAQCTQLKEKNIELQKKLANLEKKLIKTQSNQNKKLNEMCKQNQSLRKYILEKELQLDSLKQQIKNMGQRIQTHKYVQDNQQSNQIVKNQYQQILTQKMKEFYKILAQKDQQMTHRNKQYQINRNISNQQIYELKSVICNLQTELLNLNQDRSSCHQLISEYQEMLKNYQEKQEQLNRNYKIIEQQCLKMMQDLKQKEQIQKELNKKIIDLEKNQRIQSSNQSPQHICDLNNELDRLRLRNNQLNIQLMQCKKLIQEQQIQKCKSQLTNSRSQGTLNNYKKKIDVSKMQTINSLKIQKKDLQQKLNQMYKEIINLNQTIYQINSKVKQYEAQSGANDKKQLMNTQLTLQYNTTKDIQNLQKLSMNAINEILEKLTKICMSLEIENSYRHNSLIKLNSNSNNICSIGQIFKQISLELNRVKLQNLQVSQDLDEKKLIISLMRPIQHKIIQLRQKYLLWMKL